MKQATRRTTRSVRALWLGSALMVGLAGCSQTRSHQFVEEAPAEADRVLLMPPDIVVLQLDATGLPLPRQEWTTQVEDGFAATAQRLLAERESQLVRYRADGDVIVPYRDDELPAVRLQRALMQTALNHHYGEGEPLPADAETQWSLGTSVAPLRDNYDADLALFVVYRQANADTGRTMLTLVQIALFGALQPTSQSVALASLVDLRSGRLVWTNLLQAQGFDMNAPSEVEDRARELLTEMPL